MRSLKLALGVLVFAFLIAGSFLQEAESQDRRFLTDSSKVEAGDSINEVRPSSIFLWGTVTVVSDSLADTLIYQSAYYHGSSNFVTQQVKNLASGSAVSTIIVPGKGTYTFQILDPVINGFRLISTAAYDVARRSRFYYNLAR